MRVPSPLFAFTLAALAAGLLSCGDAEGNIRLVLGGEPDSLSRTPAPVTLVVQAVDLTQNEREIGRTPLPASGLDLGELPKNEIAAVRVRGLLADGSEVVRGGSLYFQWGALELSALEVFVQRRGELARLPEGSARAAYDAPVTAVVAGRYVMEAKERELALYDLLRLRSVGVAGSLPRPARSIATFGSSAVVVDEQGASYVDLNDGRSADLETPAGGSFGEVAGGVTVSAPDGTQFIVGATRPAGGPSARVLRLAPEGDVSIVSLAFAREGACAAWVEGRGLVVWGGSADAPGGEVLAPDALTATPLAYPPDPVRGCGAAALDAGRLVVAGGTLPPGAALASIVDLACAGGCAKAPWPGVAALPRAEAARVAEGVVLIVGDDDSGATRAYRATSSELREVPLRAPRRGGRLVVSPASAAAPTKDGRPALVVGGAAALEQYLD